MERLKISSQNFNQVLKKAAELIKKGKVLVCPTDTVYGLLADATSKKAVQKIWLIKKRPKQKALPIFIKDIKMAKRFAQINRRREKFLKKVWPGKVTVVLKRKKNRMKLYGVNKKTIALRIPKYELLLRLANQLNCPLTGTSANTGGPASTEIREVIKQFKNKKLQPDLILDAGNLKKSKPSTVIDLTDERPKILRKGSGRIPKISLSYE